MKQPTALITDSTADIPPVLLGELGVRVVPVRFAFDEESFLDGEMDAADFYSRLAGSPHAPRTFGVSEAAFREAFSAALESADSVLCMVTPFDVSPTFTTASAAMLSMDDVDIKILNPGVASAGLCSLLIALAPLAAHGRRRADIIAALDTVEPQCDTLFVPADVSWLQRAGRIPLIEDRLGPIGEGTPVVRVGTRITGVALEASRDAAITRAVQLAASRADPGQGLIFTVSHANDPQGAAEVANALRRRWTVDRLVVTELSSTLGAQLGPGAVGIGVAPASEVTGGSDA